MPKRRNFTYAAARLQGAVPRKQDFRQGAAYRLAKGKQLRNRFGVNQVVFQLGRFNPGLTK